MNTKSEISASEKRQYFAVAAKGTEGAVTSELNELGLADIKTLRGGVSFQGNLSDLYRANLFLRSSSRVLMPMREFAAETAPMLYDQVRRIYWEKWIRPEATIAVECSLPKPDSDDETNDAPPLRDDALRHSHFASLKIKDAIVDRIREKRGSRPDVDPKAPDFLIVAHVTRGHGTRCVISIDSSGKSLHERGYRPPRAEAPLKETLAASILALAGWNGQTPLIDPFCGSGTLIVEAAMKALRFPPGLLRQRFGFMNWPDFDLKLWEKIKAEAGAQVLKEIPVPILGSDSSSQAINLALASAKAAGVEKYLEIKKSPITELKAPSALPGMLITNPPYGERIGEETELAPVYEALGAKLKHELKGWTGYILSGNPALSKHIGLKSSQRLQLYNGPIECRLLKYEMY